MNSIPKDDESKLRGFTIDYYSDKWGGYTENDLKKRIEIAEPLLEPIIDSIPISQGCYILDIGTGPGTIPFSLIEMKGLKDDTRIMGIDPSLPALRFASQMAIEKNVDSFVKFREGVFENIPFPDKTFDLVISNASFNLSLNKEGGLHEMNRVLKDDGVVIIADCFRRKGANKVCDKCDNRLWAICISGTVERDLLITQAESMGLHHTGSTNLTDVVVDLVQSGKWNWREFIDFDLEYYAIRFTKN